MAVLVEAISVVVRRDAIDRSFDGGWRAFVSCVPNATLCTDSQLARVGFMDPMAVGKFVEGVQAAGLVFLQSEKCTDIVVVDQQRGPTMPCEWLDFAHIPFGKSGGKVAACWLFEGPRLAAGVHFPGKSIDLPLRAAGPSMGLSVSDFLSDPMRMPESGSNICARSAGLTCSSTHRLAGKCSSQVANESR
jgi:hypothetical protein